MTTGFILLALVGIAGLLVVKFGKEDND